MSSQNTQIKESAASRKLREIEEIVSIREGRQRRKLEEFTQLVSELRDSEDQVESWDLVEEKAMELMADLLDQVGTQLSANLREKQAAMITGILEVESGLI